MRLSLIYIHMQICSTHIVEPLIIRSTLLLVRLLIGVLPPFGLPCIQKLSSRRYLEPTPDNWHMSMEQEADFEARARGHVNMWLLRHTLTRYFGFLFFYGDWRFTVKLTNQVSAFDRLDHNLYSSRIRQNTARRYDSRGMYMNSIRIPYIPHHSANRQRSS